MIAFFEKWNIFSVAGALFLGIFSSAKILVDTKISKIKNGEVPGT